VSLRSAFADLTYAEQAERDQLRNPKAVIELRTKDMGIWGYVGDHRELKFTDKKSQAGSLTVLVPDDEHYRGWFDGQPRRTVRPIVVRLPYYTTLWFVTDYTRTRKGRKRYIEVTAVGALEHLSWIRLWPCPALPPEFQPIHYWFAFGSASTNMAAALTANLIRLQASLWSIPTGNLLELDTYNLLAKAMYPMMVNPRNKLLFDTSPWITAEWRMDDAMTAFTDICDAENMQITYQFFDPEVDEQPFPEFCHLDRPRLIFDFVEKDAPAAFTGTLVDGLLRTGLKMADDSINWILYPILGESYDDYLQKATGMIADKPWPVYTTGQYTPVDEFAQTVHTGLGTRVTAGGKSPEWLNTALVSGINALLGAAGAALAATGAAGALAGPLSNLTLGVFEPLVKDTIMAFHSDEDLRAANEAGDWRLREGFAESSSTGLSLETGQGMKKAHFKARDYTSHTIKVQNGSPYFVGKHINLGDALGVADDAGEVDVDYLEEITYEDTESALGDLTLQVGKPDAELEPGAMALGKIRGLTQWMTRAALAE
jgi:hypothetical protein